MTRKSSVILDHYVLVSNNAVEICAGANVSILEKHAILNYRTLTDVNASEYDRVLNRSLPWKIISRLTMSAPKRMRITGSFRLERNCLPKEIDFFLDKILAPYCLREAITSSWESPVLCLFACLFVSVILFPRPCMYLLLLYDKRHGNMSSRKSKRGLLFAKKCGIVPIY